jgi:hypothetical protein
MVINVDSHDVYSTYSWQIHTTVNLGSGPHAVIVKAWDNKGNYFAQPLNITVGAADGRSQLLHNPFEAGVAHAGGAYGFETDNYLLEGAKRIRNLGSDSIFLYLTPDYRTKYPDRADHQWPGGDPPNVVELAKTPPFRKVFAMNFRTFVLTVNTFANRDNLAAFVTDPNAAAAEEQEFYDLAMYLYTHYAHSGKTFILKNWEGDWAALGNMDQNSGSISPAMVDAMITMTQARQNGVARARRDSGSPAGLGVFHAVEVNRVLDVSRRGLVRVINAVVPVVKPDMVTYSSYDSTSLDGTADATVADLKEAINVIRKYAADPQGLGNRRMMISEYGDSEELYPSNVGWRPQVILQTAKAEGLSGAFVWQVFDNECKNTAGAYLPTGVPPGGANRASNWQCLGDWLVRPDGSLSPTVGVLGKYWD